MAAGRPIASGLVLSALLVLRARRRLALRPTLRPTLHGIAPGRLDSLDGLRGVVEELAARFAETGDDRTTGAAAFARRVRRETVRKVARGEMSAATARVALLALCRERDAANGLLVVPAYSGAADPADPADPANPANPADPADPADAVRYAVDPALVSGTLHGWYRAPHTDGSGVEVFYGDVAGKAGVADGSKIHTTGATRIGNHVFTCNDKIYALGKEGTAPPPPRGGQRVGALASRDEFLEEEEEEKKEGKRARRLSAVDMEQDALLAQFHARMLSSGSGGGKYDGNDGGDEEGADAATAAAAAGEDGATLGASSIPLADYLFAHLKSEVIVLDTAGLAFIQREVDRLDLASDKKLPSADAMRGFRLAHNVIKRVVCEVCGNQRDGQRWNLGPSYSSFLDKVPRHQISAIWDAMRRLVVWYDNLASGAKKFSATNVEVMANLPHLVLLARHVKMQMGIRSLMMNSRTAPSPAHRLQMQKSARELAKMHGHMSLFRGEADDIMAGRGKDE
jgi:hypothetical protein